MNRIFEYLLNRHFMLTIFTLVLLISFVLSLITVATWNFLVCVVVSATLVYISL
jgi:membrane-anchored protein YejM (alkaline phosphatase superfamily)